MESVTGCGSCWPITAPGDAHDHRFNKKADGKPRLAETMRSVLRKLEGVLETLLVIGRDGRLDRDRLLVSGEMKLNRKHVALLEEHGIQSVAENGQRAFFSPDALQLVHAWKWMAEREGTVTPAFSRCMFRKDYPYTRDIYARLSGDSEAFGRLTAYLEQNGYVRLDNRDGKVALDYLKSCSSKEMPVKDAWAERTYAGISAQYDPLIRIPAYYCLRLPRAKEILQRFHEMDDEVKAFVLAYNHKCNGCGYCTQTDKTGTRSIAAVPVNRQEKEYLLCPLFPGFYYCWTALDAGVAEGIMRYLSFIERALAPVSPMTR